MSHISVNLQMRGAFILQLDNRCVFLSVGWSQINSGSDLFRDALLDVKYEKVFELCSDVQSTFDDMTHFLVDFGVFSENYVCFFIHFQLSV